MITRSLFLRVLFFAVMLGCVDKVDLALESPELPIIIEGMVTNDPGRDTIKITKAYPADGGFYTRVGITGAKVRIISDAGDADNLTDIGRGFYVTNALQGAIGRTYQLFVTFDSGFSEHQYQSTPQRMLPAGEIDSISFQFIRGRNTSTGLEEEGFNVYVDSRVDASSTRRIRYKVLGTYKVQTDPSLIIITEPCPSPPCPTRTLPCAEGCECCICWATEKETSPILLNPKFVGGTDINRFFVHYIPINNYTFNSKYRVEITQMELSQDVYDFYFAVQKQLENAASLFQPPFFELPGNINPITDAPRVVGIFSAAAVTRKEIYIYRSDIPYELFSQVIAGDCRSVVPNSTNQQPPYWQ